MDRISRYSRWEESVWFGDIRIGSLLFVDDVVLLASSDCDRQDRIVVEYKAVGMTASTSAFEAMVLCWITVDCFLQVGSELLPQVRE